MAAKAGVWIDHKQAVVVMITDAGQEIKKVVAGGAESAATGGSRPQHQYTPNDFVPEDRRERKLASESKKMYEAVLACLKGADALLILGPSEAKSEFSKHIKAKKVRGLAVEVEAADKITNRQLAAKVKKHFSPAPASKAVALKKPLKKAGKKPIKKTTKTAKVKRAKPAKK